MHFKDWLCEVVDLMQEQDSQDKALVQLAEDVAITAKIGSVVDQVENLV
jgi:hypothetical protein